MQVKFVFPVFFYCALLSGWAWLTGCSKNERAIVEARFTNLEFKTFSTDTLQFKVVSNDITLTDSLFAPNKTQTVSVQYFDPEHRIQLFDVLTNRNYLDTVISYKSGFINSITFFQPSAGADFIWIGPPVNESLPPADYAKISIRYTHAALPDLLKVVVENNPSGTRYVATDSFELKKNEFSRYFLAYNASIRKVRLKLYSTDSRRKTMAYAEDVNFALARSANYNIYLFRNQGTGTGDSIRILGEKLY